MNWQRVQQAINNPLIDQKCQLFHQGPCNSKAFWQLISASKSLYKTYLFIHLIPFLLFKRKKTVQNPKYQIKKLVIGFIKSMLFAGGTSAVIRRIICFINSNYKCSRSNFNSIIAGAIAGQCLLLESQSRRIQIAIYCLGKFMDLIYQLLKRRGVPMLPNGELLLMGIALSLICFFYTQDRKLLRSGYLYFLDKMIGEL